MVGLEIVNRRLIQAGEIFLGPVLKRVCYWRVVAVAPGYVLLAARLMVQFSQNFSIFISRGVRLFLPFALTQKCVPPQLSYNPRAMKINSHPIQS